MERKLWSQKWVILYYFVFSTSINPSVDKVTLRYTTVLGRKKGYVANFDLTRLKST